MRFELHAPYAPAGDQPQAIAALVEGIRQGQRHQVLLGVTGSGKTFTIANVIAQVQKPTLIISHNKTLAAQLYTELKAFFPKNKVEYFISYYDYYQPEAYLPETDTYIEKDSSINALIERLRLRALAALLSGRKDVIIVASVSCIYGLGNPSEIFAMSLELRQGQIIPRRKLLYHLIDMLYERSVKAEKPGTFAVKGDTITIRPIHDDCVVKIQFWGNEIEKIALLQPENYKKIAEIERYRLYPASAFATQRTTIEKAIPEIRKELKQQLRFLESQGKLLEAKRLKQRIEHELELLQELGHCKGIENYSRYLTGRKPGERPYCLLDYFPADYLVVIDESHITVPQLRGMYAGDRSRKLTLVEYGFRLPSALDNRPLTFDEFESLVPQVIYMSATPGPYELRKAKGVVVEQLVRPTGLMDPPVEVRPVENQVDDLIGEIHKVIQQGGRVLVTVLTKRMAEELCEYLINYNIRARYLHSDIDAIDRVEILRALRQGDIDVIVGINLLREGLDLPEVMLVAILDADKEGFLRSATALIQTAGRAARNVHGRVILYADKITPAIQTLLDETRRRRKIQKAYNDYHGIVPTTVRSEIKSSLKEVVEDEKEASTTKRPDFKQLSIEELKALRKQLYEQMMAAVEKEQYLLAARLRDEMFAIDQHLKAWIYENT